jgi:hypothetical protein
MARTRRSSSSTKSRGTKNNTDFSNIQDRIVGVSETLGSVSMVIYGRSGTGKTTIASSFPKPILFLDIKEEGTDSIADFSDDEIKVLPVESWDDIEQIYWFLESGNHNFKSVIIDTVTQMQDVCMKGQLQEAGKDFASQQIWGNVAGLMKTWTMNFRDLPMQVAFLAQDRVHETDSDDDEEEIDPSVGPRLSPSVAATLNAAVKVIGYTYIQEVVKKSTTGISRSKEYRLRVGPHPYYITKIRKPKNKDCPEYIPDPTFDKIIDVMKGRYEEKPKKKKSKK